VVVTTMGTQPLGCDNHGVGSANSDRSGACQRGGPATAEPATIATSQARSPCGSGILWPMPQIASLVLYAADAQATGEFYRALGLELEEEQHEEGPVHFAIELGPLHFAIYQAGKPGQAPERRSAGDTFPGFYVGSLDDVASALRQLGAPIITDHEDMPWGCRIVARDPDGRAVEVNQKEHCPGT
jgi:lactoylglutathione lyase